MHRTACMFVAAALVAACGGGAPAEGPNQSIAKALAGPPPPPTNPVTKPGESTGPRQKVVGPGELPWSFQEVKGAITPGLSLVYDRTGTDAKGKRLQGKFKWQARRADDSGVGVVGVPTEGPVPPGSDQLATISWGNLSPFFAIERAEPKVTGRETIQVPAGSFDCVVAEIRGFFGAEQKVWMIVDRPGVYAKVVDSGNASEPKDKTEITYELAEIVAPAAGTPPT
jgi:hypothetical protein